ncbi:MAG: hypothetical protein AB8G86_08545 [Saprospiraceae bacterium]
MEEHDSIDLRSKAFQEVLGEPPSWLLRWGISAIFLAFIALFVVGYFFKYPETVKAPIRLETSNPPVEIMTMTSGTVKPFFKEQVIVERNATLSQIRNINSGNAVQILALDSMLMHYNKKGFVNVPNFKEMDKWDLGPVKGEYLKFYQAFFGKGSTNIAQNQTINSFDENIRIFRQDIIESEKIIKGKQARLDKIPTRRKSLKDTYSKNATSKNLLNLETLLQEETRLIEEIKATEQRISDKRREIINLDNQKSLVKQGVQVDKATREQNIEFATSRLQSKIDEWKIGHIIKAPISGTLVYQDKLKAKIDSFSVERGERIFAIIPENAEQDIEGKLYLSSEESLKIKNGQEVRIRITTYKPSEYGLLSGIVIDKATLPTSGKYLIRVQLTNGMKTSKNREIHFEHQMQGEAEIITEDRRFTDLILKQFKEMLTR